MKKSFQILIAFISMLAVFFTVGIFAIGTTKATGESTHYESGTTIYYDVSLASNDRLDSVYLNIGAIHAPVGEEVVVTVKYSTSSTGTSFSSFTTKTIKIENLTSNQNYNWIAFATAQKKKDISRISFSANSSLEINEIVCLDTEGKVRKLAMSSSTKDYSSNEVAKSFDAQDDFVTKTSSYYQFSNAEAMMLASIDNIRIGNDYASTGVYTLASEYNHLANLMIMPSVAIFGNSPFALRLPSLIATTLLIAVAFLFLKLVTKNELTALISTVLFAPALGVSLAYTGGAYAHIACFLLLSAYFAYKFFAKGIYSKAIVKSSLNVFWAGLFSALALAMDTVAIFPVLGVATILAFGWRRQALAKKIELAQGNEDERKIRLDYNRKDRISSCFAIISFFGVYFILAILSTIICYPAIARAYSADISFGSAIWEGIAQSFVGGNALSTASVGNIFAWFIGVNGSVGYLLLSIAGFISLGALATIVVRAFVKKQNGKEDLRLRRNAIVFGGGMLCTFIAGLVAPSTSLAYFGLFAFFYSTIIVTAISLGVKYFIKHKGNK